MPRVLFFALLATTALGLTLWLGSLLAAGGWTTGKLLALLCFLPIAPWLGICVGNALPGFVICLAARDSARAVLPVEGNIERGPIRLRTAILVTIRNEDVAAVLARLLRLRDGLADPAHFTAFVLSDTQDPTLAAAEEAACAGRVAYRRRTDNTGFKAGNVMEFLDHRAEGFDLALVLDADSDMTPAAVRRLVRIMQADDRMGLVQHLTAGRPAEAGFARLFQFGMRAGMRIWATGQAFWQGREGPYWGHNAIFRIAPFRAHCRLALLPDGSTILSHDQVEAAKLAAAGWGVCIWADDTGSNEASPPAMPEFLHRDTRWLAGNLQYRHLLTLPGFRPMGRWQLVQAMLLFAGAPLYVALFVLAAVMVAPPPPGLYPFAAAWALAVYSPKLLGYTEALLVPARRAAYGGGPRLLAGTAAEFVFTLLLDAPALVSKTLAMIRLLLGTRPAWLPQNRSERGVPWAEAARLFWPHTMLGLAGFALLARGGLGALLLAAPFAGGLLTAIPFCVATSRPGFSRWLRRHRIAAMPEELIPWLADRDTWY